MAAVLKVDCQGQLHRVLLSEACVNYEAVQEAIQKLYPNENFAAKYLDDENDLCTLCRATFSDFVNMAGEHNGRRILKVVLNMEATKPPAAGVGSAAVEDDVKKCIESSLRQLTEKLTEGNAENPIAAMMKMGKDMFETFAKKGFYGHHGGHGWPHGGHHGGHWWHGKQVKFMICQLHKNGGFDESSAAALGIYLLPKLLSHALDHSEKIDWKATRKFQKLRPTLEDLQVLIASTPGLEQCEGSIADLIAKEGSSASKVLLEVLTALDVLPLDAQVVFFKAFYNSQKPRLQATFAKADKWMSWMPTRPLQHEGIWCDGCNHGPLQGLRFKCKDCPDYDLCAECFPKKDVIHSGDSSVHEFEIVTPWGKGAGKGMGKCLGKGMGKFWGKGMGKCWSMGEGKGEGKFGHGGFNDIDSMCESRPCATPGCEFAATWHPTHCCGGCQHGHHGPRCGKVSVAACQAEPTEEMHLTQSQQPLVADAEDLEDVKQNQAELAEMKAHDPAKLTHRDKAQCRFDFTFPVVVEDGRKLTISWNVADDLAQVAVTFANAHGIPAEEVPTIKAFLEHVVTMSKAKNDEEAKQDLDSGDQEGVDLKEALKQLEEMGLGDGEVLKELLKSYGGSVARVIEALTTFECGLEEQ